MFLKFLKEGMMHSFQLNVLLKACFAWLSYLVHSCTNTILLHLFTPSVGGGGEKAFSRSDELGLLFLSLGVPLKIQGPLC